MNIYDVENEIKKTLQLVRDYINEIEKNNKPDEPKKPREFWLQKLFFYELKRTMLVAEDYQGHDAIPVIEQLPDYKMLSKTQCANAFCNRVIGQKKLCDLFLKELGFEEPEQC